MMPRQIDKLVLFNEHWFELASRRLRGRLRKNNGFFCRFLNCIVNWYGRARDTDNSNIETSRQRFPVPPTQQEWLQAISLQKSARGVHSRVTIVVQMKRDCAAFRCCIYSLLKAKTEVSHNIVIVRAAENDADVEWQWPDYLIELQTIGVVKLEESFNFALQVDSVNDIVWLNGEAEVFDDWLDRLETVVKTYHTEARIFFPFTNRATVISYSTELGGDNRSYAVSDEELDRICASNKNEKDILLVVPIGCVPCAYVRRQAVKWFVERGRNVFVGRERIRQDDCSAVLVPSIFVRNYSELPKLVEDECYWLRGVVLEKKCEQNFLIRFIRQDPLRAIRIRMDSLVLAQTLKKAKKILQICHSRGGGTEKFIKDLQCRLPNAAFLRLRPFDCNKVCVDLDRGAYPNISFLDIRNGIGDLVEFVRDIGVSRIHVHSIIDFPLTFVRILVESAGKIGVPITVTIHDYHWLCDKITLRCPGGGICLNPAVASCESCSRAYPVDNGSTDEIREVSRNLFTHAELVTVPSDDVARRMATVFKDIEFRVVPHAESLSDIVVSVENKADCFRIATIGTITEIKGSCIFDNLAEYIDENKLPAALHVIGKFEGRSKNVMSTGPYYSQTELFSRIKEVSPSVIFIASVLPETYSFVLSEALSTKIPVASFDIGAPADRLRSVGCGGNIIPLSYMNDMEKLYQALYSISVNGCVARKQVVHVFKASDYYGTAEF